MSDVLTLVAETFTTDAYGNQVASETEKEVFINTLNKIKANLEADK